MATEGHIFANLKIWLAQRVPSRSSFIDQIKRNGGSIEFLEKKADIKIADHARKEQIPGTYSYTFIEQSIRNGALVDLEEHRIGPARGEPRIVGSIGQPAKGTRTKYTAAEDRILWEWVNSHPQKGGGTDGNEIYKQLEAKHPQHPWQSWRDRFIKKLKGRPPPSTILENGPPTPPLEAPITQSQTDGLDQQADASLGNPSFTEEDAQWLLAEAEHISNIPHEKLSEAWGQVAEADKLEKGDRAHTSDEWQQYWEDVVRPRMRANDVEQAGVGANNGPHFDDDGSVRSSSDHAPFLDAPEHRGDRLSPIEIQRSSPAPSPQLPHTVEAGFTAPAPPNIAYAEKSDGITNTKPSHLTGASQEADRFKLKRKRQDDLETSGPKARTVTGSPHRHANQYLGGREIPSTPDKSPFKRRPRSPSPLFIQDDDEIEIKEEIEDEDEDDLPGRYDLGQESEPFARGLLNTIAQMERQRAGTQDIFRDRSPTLDLGVALPEGGWELEREQEPSPDIKPEAESLEPVENDGREGLYLDPDDVDLKDYDDFDDDNDEPLPSTIPETQGFFREATPMPDLDVVEPEGGFDALEPPGSPPRSPNSQQGVDTESSSSDYGAQLDVFVENAVAKGLPEAATLTALKSTSLDTELAKRVLEHMRKGKRKSRGDDEWELPADWRGVWTEADDESITAVDGRVIERLIKKHGTESYDSRRQFLSAMKGN